MANKETKLQIVVDVENRTKSAFDTLRGNLDGISNRMQQVGTAGAVAFGALSTALAFSVHEAIEAESAQNRLTKILKTSRDATDEQVQALLEQAEALQAVGVVASENVIQTQAQLATFDLEAESIARLTPAILDYVVAEKGAAATTDDFKQMTNGLAQALQGNFASLTKTGFVLDDATKALIENGTEAERTAALVGVLNSTYEGFNTGTLQTTEGSLQAVRNQFSDIAQTVGTTFLPIIKELLTAIKPVVEQAAQWARENPELTKTIVIAALAFTALLAVLLPIALVLPGIVALFTAVGAIFAFVASGPGLLIIATIAGIGLALHNIVGILDIFANHWQDTWLGIKLIAAESANAVISIVEGMINFVIEGVNKAISAINKVIAAAQKVPGIGKFLKTLPKLSTVDLGGFDTNLIASNDLASRSSAASTPQNIIQMAGNVFLDQDVAEQIGDLIMGKLKLSSQL